VIKEKPGLHFVTENGNSYFYSDIDGTVTPTIYRDINSVNEKPFPNRPNIVEPISDLKNQIELVLKRDSFRQLTLVITDQCNLRCRYCAYSGNYLNNRTHESIYMPWKIAEQALMKYHIGYMFVKDKSPSLLPSISFYGGEPLLNFGLIRDVTVLANKLFMNKVRYNLTTNGTLLTSDMLNFFKDNDYHLAFSLNGDKDEHDRLRVFPDGSGTFEILWHKLKKVRLDYPQYFKHNCSIISVYDSGTDLVRMSKFFDTRRDKMPVVSVITPISWLFTEWYNRYSINDRNRFDKDYKNFKKVYINQLQTGKERSPFITGLFALGYQSVLDRMQNFSEERPVLPLTAACMPGHKIAVDVKGNFHCCERINEKFPIGDVEMGLDINSIENLINKYRTQIYPECYKCNVTRICRICFAQVASDGKFERNPANLCQVYAESQRRVFSELWTLFENGVPETVFSYDKENKYTGGCLD